MNVWAISDLHLSFARPERRERYASRWADHAAKVERNWREAVRPDDVVLVPGDLSMARNHRELQPDLDWLHRLPGHKVIAPGNHDSWWNGLAAIRPMLRPSTLAVEGDAVAIGGMVICGARGIDVLPDDPGPEQVREAAIQYAQLESALEVARRLRTSPEIPLYVLWHHPPFDGHGRAGPWVAMLEEAKVTACVYGHLHAAAQWARAVQGTVGGVRYACVSADAIGFRPLRIGPNSGESGQARRYR